MFLFNITHKKSLFMYSQVFHAERPL